ncbi:MAG: aspartyl protease family protein [Gemmataceae bacterium]|nr:aspartyl protease family protein [Gemmataceae bacterium]
MSHFCLAVRLGLIVTSQAAALPSAGEVKGNVRKAVGFDAFQKPRHGIDLEGAAEFMGLPGTFRMRLHPDGRYARVIEAFGTQAVGFDGKTRWGRNFDGPPLDLRFEEADRDRFLFGVLCQLWLAADGGFKSVVDVTNSGPHRLELILSHPDAGVAARLVVNPATWLPELLTVAGGLRPRVFDFSDYRSVAGVAVPAKIGQNRSEGGQWVTAERGGPAGVVRTDPFARPVVPAGVVFDHAIPAMRESRKGPGGMVFVRPAIDGKPGPWFVLDSGNATQTVIAAGVADRLGLAACGNLTLAGVGGKARGKFRTADRFTLGPATVPRPVFGDCPDALTRGLSEAAGAEVGGFIGRDFLARVVAEVDPAAGTAAVYDPVSYRLPAGGAWEPVRFNGRAPCVHAEFDGKYAGWYLFDPGFSAPLVFNLPAVNRGKLLGGLKTTPRTIIGIGGSETVQAGPGGEFRAFGRPVTIASVLYAVSPAGGHTDPYTLGVIGPSALGLGTLIFDYPNSRIGFAPKP